MTSEAAYAFWKHAEIAINQADGDASKVTWGRIEEEVIREWVCDKKQPLELIVDAICAISPGAASILKVKAIRILAEKIARDFDNKEGNSGSSSQDREMIPK